VGIEKIIAPENLRDVSNDGDLHRWLRNFDLNFYRNHGHFHGVADLESLPD
jgi:hypothetical protein